MTTADALLSLARKQVGEKYVLGATVPKGNPEWSGPWDCAEFASWCVYQVTGTLFGCRPRNGNPDLADAYSGFWMEDAARIGRKISIGQASATAGSFLLRAPQPGATGHVVISAGGGRTVEAHSSKRGVIESQTDGRRWTTGVLVPGIDVKLDAEPQVPRRPGLVLRLKVPPMKGELVKDIQKRLRELDHNAGPIDGEFGPQTAAAVEAFQHSKGLLIDGEVGEKTAKALGVAWNF